MKQKRARSAGIQNPVRNAVLFGLITVASIVLILLGVADMRETGRTGSPLVMLGIFPAILCPTFFFYYFSKIRTFRDMQNGRIAIARWTLSTDEFKRFCDEEARIPAKSIMVNFYKPPRKIPAEGVEVIFSDNAVLIGGGYFPLSTSGKRAVQSVRHIASNPASIEFGVSMRAIAKTSSSTIDNYSILETLRVPVAANATKQAGEILQHFQNNIDRR